MHHQNDSREREDESADVEVINFLTTQLEDAKRETEHLEHEKEVLIEGFKEIEAVKVSELRKVFNTIDADDSGEIDVDEFMNAMKNDTSVREFFGLNYLNSEMSDAEEFFEKNACPFIHSFFETTNGHRIITSRTLKKERQKTYF